MTRVLVTGGTGFVGRQATAALLARGIEVHVLGRGPTHASKGETSKAYYHQLDLLDGARRGALVEEIGATHLLHMAWVTDHGAFWAAPANLDWLSATLGLVRAFAASGGRRVVSVGTCAEYDWANLADGGDCDEDRTPLRPTTLYGETKLASGRVLARFAEVENLSHGHARLFLLYGENEHALRLAPSVIRSLADGQEAKTSSGEQIRDFIDSRDAGRALALLLTSEQQGAVNVGSGQTVAVKAVARKIAALMNRESLLVIGGLPDRADDPPRLTPSLARLQKATGFAPEYTLQDGLTHAISWWAAQTRAS